MKYRLLGNTFSTIVLKVRCFACGKAEWVIERREIYSIEATRSTPWLEGPPVVLCCANLTTTVLLTVNYTTHYTFACELSEDRRRR